MSNTSLLSFAQYAHARGLNPSTVSRQVAKGKIPFVTLEGGERRIDPVAADKARRENSNIICGHGGRPDRSVRRRTVWRSRQKDGYDGAQKAILNVMRARWPGLVKAMMLHLGADELNAARAVFAVREMTECLACSVFEDMNHSRIWDYRAVLLPIPQLEWGPEAEEFFASVKSDDPTGAGWFGEPESPPEAEELHDAMMSAGAEAAP